MCEQTKRKRVGRPSWIAALTKLYAVTACSAFKAALPILTTTYFNTPRLQCTHTTGSPFEQRRKRSETTTKYCGRNAGNLRKLQQILGILLANLRKLQQKLILASGHYARKFSTESYDNCCCKAARA